MFMNSRLKRLPARFYCSNNGREPVREWLKELAPEDRKAIGEDIKDVDGREPVREWLKELEPEDRKAIGEDIKDVEFSWPIGMPLFVRLGTNCGKSAAIYRSAGLPG
jgi:hypothetical protein